MADGPSTQKLGAQKPGTQANWVEAPADDVGDVGVDGDILRACGAKLLVVSASLGARAAELARRLPRLRRGGRRRHARRRAACDRCRWVNATRAVYAVRRNYVRNTSRLVLPRWPRAAPSARLRMPAAGTSSRPCWIPRPSSNSLLRIRQCSRND